MSPRNREDSCRIRMMVESARSKAWTFALWVSGALALGWFLVPGQCVVLPAGLSGFPLAGSSALALLRPLAFDAGYLMDVPVILGPPFLVAFAALHWSRKTTLLRPVAAVYATLLAVIVAFHPARRLPDLELMGVVGAWGVILLVALRSQASPGSALIALLAIQLAMIEIWIGVGPYRGLPFWCLMGCSTVLFAYGIFHYARKLRHSILGRFTTVRRRKPGTVPPLGAPEGGGIPPPGPGPVLEGDHWKV